MTPKQKAEDLVKKYWGKYCPVDDVAEYTICHHLAKECALILVDELIINCQYGTEDFWKEVKAEIENV